MTEEEIRKLGFKDEAEMLLYQDVCGIDIPIIGQRHIEKLLHIYYNRNNMMEYQSKAKFEKYIFAYGLADLFEKVKNMSEIDRLAEIYNYYAYAGLMCSIYEKNSETEISKSIYDIIRCGATKYLQTKEEYLKMKNWKQTYLEKADYICNQAKIRLGTEYPDFEEKIENATKLEKLVNLIYEEPTEEKGRHLGE